MSIYTGSRYKDTKVYNSSKSAIIFGAREKYVFDPKKCQAITVTNGMTLDNLAYDLYGDPQFDWILREVNRTKDFTYGLTPGDIILAPTYSEVLRIYG